MGGGRHVCQYTTNGGALAETKAGFVLRSPGNPQDQKPEPSEREIAVFENADFGGVGGEPPGYASTLQRAVPLLKLRPDSYSGAQKTPLGQKSGSSDR